MNNDINVDVKTLRPLTRFIYTIGVLPTSYLMSMTFEEQSVWLCNYLQTTVIPTINNNGKAVEELQELYKELQDYVNNFIDTLDIQTEVDNKLEEMYESGQLAEIIAQFLEYAGVFGFDTKADLKAGTSFVNGSITMTLGDTTYNDGKINFYKIRNVLTTDVIDDDNILAITNDPTLIAEKIHNYYINDIYNLVNENKNLINTNREHELAESIQLFNPTSLRSIFGDVDGWSFTGIEIFGNKGYVVANDWTSGGSGGTKFNIASFDYVGGEVSNPQLEVELATGHSNDICKISDTELLIVCTSNLVYRYDTTNNDLEVISNLPLIHTCSSYNNKIYLTQFRDSSNNETNQLYEYIYNNDVFTLINTYTINNLYSKMNKQTQGSVIYDNLLIYPSYAPMKLCVVDLNTKKYLKTQLIINPYIPEIESGYVYNNTLYLVDADQKTFNVDLYAQECYGGYDGFPLARSNSMVELLDEPVLLTPGNWDNINFSKVMSFNNRNSDTNINTLGAQFEYLTIFPAVKNSSGSNTIHLLTPIIIPCFKNFAYESVSWTTFKQHFTTEWMDYHGDVIEVDKFSGEFEFGGGDTVPSLRINVDNRIYVHGVTISGSSSTPFAYCTNYSSDNFQMFIVKIIGHRKVGLGY